MDLKACTMIGFDRRISRRRFISGAAGTLGSVAMPYLSRAADRPMVTHGVQSGDVSADGGVVWARADRPSQMLVEVATTESFSDARALPPIAVLPESDFTAKMLIENLPGGQEIFYRVKFRDLSHPEISGEPVTGRFRTAPTERRDVSFVWGGDVAGFLRAFGRHHLRRRHHRAGGQTTRRQALEKHHHPGEGKGCRDARRVPRRASIQFP
jgi:alkaline phosphatase D